jgi:hypothetical protein
MSERRSAPSGERAGLASHPVLGHPVTLRQVDSEDSGKSKSLRVDARDSRVRMEAVEQRHMMRRPSAGLLGMIEGPLVADGRRLWKSRWLTK